MIYRVISLAIGYVCGLFQTAYLYGRWKHIDIREHGSGNAGTTNALRTLGKKAGAITFLGDLLKPMVAMLLCYLFFGGQGEVPVKLLCLYGGAGAVLGHVFPVYLGFRGGKGIASLGGMTLLFSASIGIWYAPLVCIALFILSVAITRYVSLGSLLMLVCYMCEIVILGQLGFTALEPPLIYECYGIYLVLVCIAAFKHRANVGRLIHGTESKLGQKK